MRRLLIPVVLVSCLGACGKSPGERMAEAAISAATGQKVAVDKDGGNVTIKTDKGDMKINGGASATLPASFPKDVYLPAGYTVESSMEMPNALILSLHAPGQVGGMYADASKQMQAQGWKQTMAMQQTAESQMLAFEKADREAMLSFYTNDGDGGGVKVGMQLTKK